MQRTATIARACPAEGQAASGPEWTKGSLEFSPPYARVRKPLLIDRAQDATGRLVKVSEARHGVQYRCVLANCGEPLFLRRGSGSSRAHFFHRRGTACINPATLHDFAVRLTARECAILGPRTDLIEGTLPEDIYAGEAEAEALLRVPEPENGRRLRRADVLIRQPDRVIAVEFVRTHGLDHGKRADYCALAEQLAQQRIEFALLVVELSADEACFRNWTLKQWQDYVLFDAHRRWRLVPPSIPRTIPAQVRKLVWAQTRTKREWPAASPRCSDPRTEHPPIPAPDAVTRGLFIRGSPPEATKATAKAA